MKGQLLACPVVLSAASDVVAWGVGDGVDCLLAEEVDWSCSGAA